MKRILTILAGGLCLGVLVSAAPAAEDEMASLERQFRELPIEARRLTGPLFWLHGDESRQQLEAEIAKVAEGGNGCFTAESRPHSDWLGPGWYRDLGICLEAAKKHNLKMWIFDERWWPSQSIGGKVPPRYAAKRLEAASTDVEGPRTFEADGFGGERYVAAVAGKVEAASSPKVEAASSRFILGDSLVDLAPFIHDGKLAWQIPAGKWKIMKFTHVQAPPLTWAKQLAVDGASKDCVDWYIQTVYQPHYDHFAADFGKTIVGFFYDEPETPGDWGTELNGVLAERGVDWKKAYVAYKFELAGEEQIAAKYQYLEALADAWGRTMYGGITCWCHAHHVMSHGHFMEHAGLYHSPKYCAGDMMRLQRYSDMGGIDAVGRQFIMGKREEAANPPIWQTPKLASSISHVFGKPDDVAMVEIFGGCGQKLTYREMKWWADHMQVSGVNFLIPHSFNPRAPYDKDWPPYFYNGGFEPRWPLYRVFADYTSRLSLMLTGGRHVCPVAILFSGNLGQVGKMIPPEGLSTALQDAQLDCDWLPMDVFERDAVIQPQPAVAPDEPAEIQLQGERYRVLIVPPVGAIPYATLAKAKEFYERGGIVIGYGFLPSKSATIGKGNTDILALCREIWGETADRCHAKPAEGLFSLSSRNPSGGISEYHSWIGGVLPCCVGTDGIRPLLADNWLHVLHRKKAGRDIFLVANQNHRGAGQEYTFRVTTAGVPECWDPMRNEIVVPRSWRTEAGTVTVSLTLEPLETVLLVFQPQRIIRPPRIEPDTKPIREPIAIVRDPPRDRSRGAFSPTPDLKRKPLTLSPVKAADPFRGRVTIPADVHLLHCSYSSYAHVENTRATICLEMDDLPGEAAAVTVNGQRAGGLIGRPLRLDITRYLKTGENSIVIEPLAPKAARLAFYPGA